MNHIIFLKTLLLCLIISFGMKAQVNIINVSVQPFNLTPEALLNVNIMNNEGEQQVTLLSQLYNSSGAILLTVKSQPFKLVKGLNSGASSNRRVAATEFSSNSQASYLKNTHNLASGRYKVCSAIVLEGGADKLDDFCEEIEADFNQYLYLISPFDQDTVETKYPMLSWTHSEPFSILNQGEFYRMIVSEIKKGQTADESITVNTPVMVKNYLQVHQLQYPYDAKELKEGGRYAWQVQKMSDGVVINKTEAWSFNLRQMRWSAGLNYVALKRELDGSFYNAEDGLVHFKFSEEYRSLGQLKFSLTNAKLQPINVELRKGENGKDATMQSMLKLTGDNQYELSLNGKGLKTGFYTLEAKNEKDESFYLKIFLP